MFACVGRKLAHLLYLLRIVSGETHEDEHAYVAQDEVEAAAAHEHVNHGGDDESEKRHEEQLAHRREVGLGGVAHERHYAERAGCDEECLDDGCHAERKEDDRERSAVHYRVEHEQKRSRRQREAVDGTADREHEHKLGDDESPEQCLVAEDSHDERRSRRNAVCGDAGDGEGEGHPYKHFAHERRESRRHREVAATKRIGI